MSQARPVNQNSIWRAVALVAAIVVIGLGTFAAISLLGREPETAQPSESARSSPSVAVTASPTVAPTPTTFAVEEGLVQVIAAEMVMQTSPSADAPEGARLLKGQTAWATGRGSESAGIDWIEIRREPSGQVGWVAAAMADGEPSLAAVHDGAIGVTSGTDVELIDLASGQRTAITSGMRVHDLAFAADGRQVALIDPYDGSSVVSIDDVTAPEPTATPGAPTFGPPAMKYPAFAANGEAVAYLVGQDFLGLSLIWLGDGPAPTYATPATLHPFTWAPDSRHIASAELVNTSADGRENWEIVVAEAGESQAIRLTRHAGFDTSPAWSPDGSAIAYLQEVDRGTTALALMDADGGDQRTLLTFDGFAGALAQPAWSPDGSRVAVAQSLAGWSPMVHLVDAHTSQHLSITAPGSECTDLTWSPTGSHIAFICAGDDGEGTAYVSDVGGRNVETLGPAWHVDWARTLEPLTLPQRD